MDDKFITREYPPTNDYPRSREYPNTRPSSDGYPRSREYPSTRPIDLEDLTEVEYAGKKPRNKFARFLHFVFVKNIGLKILALATAGLLWALIAGLGG